MWKKKCKVFYYETFKLNKNKLVKDLSKFLNINIKKSKKLLKKVQIFRLKVETCILLKKFCTVKKIYKNQITQFLSKFLPKKQKNS